MDKKRSHILLTGCIAALSFLSGMHSQNTKTRNCSDIELQEVQVIFMRLEPGPQALSVNETNGLQKEYALRSTELEKLRAAGLKGKLSFNSGAVHGGLVGCEAAKRARVVVVGDSPITRLVELYQPDGVDAIYYQSANEWRLVPANTPVLRRKIVLKPSKINPDNTEYLVEHADGSRQGGTAFTW